MAEFGDGKYSKEAVILAKDLLEEAIARLEDEYEALEEEIDELDNQLQRAYTAKDELRDMLNLLDKGE